VAIDARFVRPNGFGNLSGAYNKATGSKTCSNTYCHGTTSTPSWGGFGLACNSCHGGAPGNTTGTDRYWGAYSSAHKQHVEVTTLPTAYYGVAAANNSAAGTTSNYNFSCTSCHSDTAGGGATHAGGMATATRAAEVFFGFTSAGKSGPYSPDTLSRGTKDNGFLWTAGSCNTTYCHSDGNGGGPKMLSGTAAGQFNWGSKQNAIRCFGCHGSQDIKNGTTQALSGYTSIRTNAHARHVRWDINTELGQGNGLDCYRCHNATITAGLNSGTVLAGYSTVANANFRKSRHVNKLRDYSGAIVNPNTSVAAAGGSSGQYDATQKSCSNVYCHSNSKVGTPLGSYAPVLAKWNSGVTNQKCNYCHGTQSQTPKDTDTTFAKYSSTGVPNYATAGLGTYSANSHKKHILSYGTTNYRDTQVCYNCHAATLAMNTDSGGAGVPKFRPYSSRHTSGGYNVKMSAVNGGTYVSGTKTCNNVTCHGGAGSSAIWGAKLGCQGCHGGAAFSENYGATFWSDGTTSKIDTTTSWVGTGHGKLSGSYTGQNKTGAVNPAANFSSADMCEYCHSSSVSHKLSTNPFRLNNWSTATFGRNATCLQCHATGSTVGVTTALGSKRVATASFVDSSHYGADHLTSANKGGQFCWDCHNPHGEGNTYMLRNKLAQNSLANGAPVVAQQINTWSKLTTQPPVWASYANIGGTGICQECHTTTTRFKNDASTWAADSAHNAGTRCTDCHSHNGTTRTTAFAGAGNCDTCHGYQNTTWGVSPKIDSTGRGVGAHEVHITYLTTKRFTVTLQPANPATDAYGSANPSWTNVCGVCHTGGTHMGNGVEVFVSNNPTYFFGDGVIQTKTLYNGTPGVSGNKSCSNISCHYFTSPVWSTL